MSLGSHNTSDAGNAALEVLAVALVGAMLVCWMSFGLFAAQRDAFAAHHLARQAVRLYLLSGGNNRHVQLLPGIVARDLHLSESEVDLKLSQTGGSVKAVARVAGDSSWAVMELGK
jgi:hypothetical protein